MRPPGDLICEQWFPDSPVLRPRCQDGRVMPHSTRPYRGVQPEDRLAQRRARLLDAGLSILGSGSADEVLTVRGVCRQAAVAARYFYESFADKDALVGAVFDWVIDDLA